MNAHEAARELLALSAAGLLEASEERAVREHVRECAACAAELERLGEVAAGLAALPSPAVPPELALRTQALMAGEWQRSGRSGEGVAQAIAAALLGWLSWLALGGAYRAVTGAWPSVWVWLAVSGSLALVTAPLAAILRKAQQVKGDI